MRSFAIYICLLCVTLSSCQPSVPKTEKPDCLLLPSGEQPKQGWPAVLLLHDHGARYDKGWRKVIGNETEPWYNGMSIGDSLAAAGYVVYCADALYWGSRRSPLTQREFSDSLGGAGEWYKRVLADDKAGIDYLCSLPYVDSTRIAVAGFSYGGYRAWNLTAEDPRIKTCIAAHWMTTLAQNRHNDSWLSMYRGDSSSRRLRPQREFYEIAKTIAPRAFLLQYGTRDHLFPINAVNTCLMHLSTDSSFHAEPYDCDHEMTYRHLQDWLLFLQDNL